MRPSAGPTKTSMVGYRRLKNLIIWSLAILVLIALFYFYFGSDSKTSGPLKNLTLVLSTTSAIASEGGLKPYDNAIQFDSVSFKKNCLETLTVTEGIGNVGKLVGAWKNALSTDCRCLGELEKDVQTLTCSLQYVPTPFLILPNFHPCFYSSTETRNLYSIFSDIYFVRDRTAPLRIPDTFSPKVLKWLGGKQELLKEAHLQRITSVDNKYTQESTVFNPLRGKRPGAGGGASEETKKYVAELLKSSATDCDFCNFRINTAQDPFERVESKYSVSVSNTFKVEKFHGLILLKHHNPLEINEDMLLDGMETAQKWFHRAHLYDKKYTVPHIYWDTLPRASASQVHPHFHVALADHYYARWAHFQAAAKEYAAKHNGENYFSALNKIYSALGLAVQHGNATVMAYLTPSASHEIMLLSKEPSKDLFQLLFYCVAALRDDMELYALSAGMVFPRLIPSADGSDLPTIIRLVYRGPAEAMRADIDSLQLFGTVNVNIDPYLVISNIKTSIAKRRGH